MKKTLLSMCLCEAKCPHVHQLQEALSWLSRGLAIGAVVVNPLRVSLHALSDGFLRTSPPLGDR